MSSLIIAGRRMGDAASRMDAIGDVAVVAGRIADARFAKGQAREH